MWWGPCAPGGRFEVKSGQVRLSGRRPGARRAEDPVGQGCTGWVPDRFDPRRASATDAAAPASPPLPILVLAQAPRPRRGRCAGPGAHPAAYMKKNLTDNQI
mgnify:CR=1 FL=1